MIKQYGSGNMQALQKKYTAKGVQWLTVFSSGQGGSGYFTPDKLTAMGKDKKMSSTIVPIRRERLGRLYGATNTPDLFVINPEGKVIYSGAIDSDRSPDPEAIKGATNYVAAALDEAMAGKSVTISNRPYGCGAHRSKPLAYSVNGLAASAASPFHLRCTLPKCLALFSSSCPFALIGSSILHPIKPGH